MRVWVGCEVWNEDWGDGEGGGIRIRGACEESGVRADIRSAAKSIGVRTQLRCC